MKNPSWGWDRLDAIFEIDAGKTMSARARNGQLKTPFLRTSNVLWDEIDLSVLDTMEIPQAELKRKTLLPGDLLVCEGGEIGRAAIWSGQLETVSFQNHLHRLRPNREDVDPRFYVYFLQSAFTQLGIFEGAGNKTTIPNLSRNRLAELELPLPQLNEQLAIANALSSVRHGINKQLQLVKSAQELKQVAMRDLFSHGLRGENQKETEAGPIPETWVVIALGSLGRIGNGSTPKRDVKEYWDAGHYPWLTSAKVYDRLITAADEFVTDEALARCHLPRVKAGSLVMAITGQGKTLGNCALLGIDATVSQHLAYVSLNSSEVAGSYVRGYLETQYGYLRDVASGGGSTKGALTCAFLRELPIPLPQTREEQQEIADVLDAIDLKIDLHKRKKTVLEELFQSLLHKLMTGEVRVSDLDLSALETAPAVEVTV
jgi:type I restriction enzyme S subunit